MFKNINPFIEHLFYDNNNKIGYYDYQDNMFYILPKDKMNEYRAYSNRFITAISFIVLSGMFWLDIRISILVGSFIYLITEVLFQKKFLANCNKKIININLLRSYTISNKAIKNYTFTRIVMFGALGILIVLNALDQNLSGALLLISYIFGVGCILYTCYMTIKKSINRSKK